MNINLEITESQENIDFDFGLDACYTGSYVATPRVYEQELSTANKTMIGDVKIKPIPVSKVISPQTSGYVVTIG